MPVARNVWLPILVPMPASSARRRTIACALACGRGVVLSCPVPRATVRNSGQFGALAMPVPSSSQAEGYELRGSQESSPPRRQATELRRAIRFAVS